MGPTGAITIGAGVVVVAAAVVIARATRAVSVARAATIRAIFRVTLSPPCAVRPSDEISTLIIEVKDRKRRLSFIAQPGIDSNAAQNGDTFLSNAPKLGEIKLDQISLVKPSPNKRLMPAALVLADLFRRNLFLNEKGADRL
jgi:hypothetical protein